MTTVRAVRDDLKEILEYLLEAELAIYVNEVSIETQRVSFHMAHAASGLLVSNSDFDTAQFLSWVRAGAFSAVLRDGSLLQLTYEVSGGRVTAHRLAHVPCPYKISDDLLQSGESLADIIEMYADEPTILRSPIRFDYDEAAAAPGHPASHFTLNGKECRIAVVAPMHALRFVDFVFRNFYPSFWRVHSRYFGAGASKHLHHGRLSAEEVSAPHIMWDQGAALVSSPM